MLTIAGTEDWSMRIEKQSDSPFEDDMCMISGRVAVKYGTGVPVWLLDMGWSFEQKCV